MPTSASPLAASSPPPGRFAAYDRVAAALHWLIGVALIAQIGFGFALDAIAPRGTPPRGTVINLHKSIGIVLFGLIVLRLAWRWTHRPPPWPASVPAWQQRAARAGHAALYGAMLLQPISGYLGSNFSKHGVKFFGHAFAPWGPDLPAVYNVFNTLHIASAWVFTALIAGHVAVALKHQFLDRDRLFTRIWPYGGRAAGRPSPGASR